MDPVPPDSVNAVGDGRPSWNEYFMAITDLVASRATCLRRKVGAVLVKDKRILCSGYNGAPSQIPHCIQTGCLREQLKVPSGEKHELCRGVHAEQNVIIQAAYHGIAVAGATLYCTTQPCSICAKMIINAGIKKVYFKEGYDDPLSLEMFAQAGVELIQLD
ncbi:cytidine deaminase [Desulfobacter hydrogenophilus]|uniref:Cytidine deaminase n=1 Tax=Desulfobacter hydrogenophilus TaxID=2291 RepID=A0A328FBS1_9BACT|nr:cytidine/deoxycytidylate deaminase family protein [Desulfobacter hydrogenophilus]NDY70518.1 cytidine deaminase [Desulfobacter hydrogenophilus]QBH13894.1 cytidine deaminase [Desulfobacter hydrogenophilus]RAM02124.1 cytidine deaminase [Desulfobacter hydrogenophilus]